MNLIRVYWIQTGVKKEKGDPIFVAEFSSFSDKLIYLGYSDEIIF